MITELHIQNFKSFGPSKRPLDLHPLNFIVGANASGKTNLVSALRFLKIALLQNVEVAVAEFEGAAEVRNKIQRERKDPKPVRIALRIDGARLGPFRRLSGPSLRLKTMAYNVDIDLRSQEEEPTILRERLIAELYDGAKGTFRYSIDRNKEHVTIIDEAFNLYPASGPLPIAPQDASRLMAGTAFIGPPITAFRNFVEGWSFFNINPEAARRPCKESSDLSLGEMGENLSAILHRLEKTNGGAKQFENIMNGLRDAVPGFKTIRTRRLEVEGKLAFQVIEDRIRGAINPKSASDGTIRLLALMVIAHWSAGRSTLLAIEEPENGLHPHLSKHVIDLLRTASQTRQVLVTTHNADFLDELEPEEVILCDKEDGFTIARHASEIGEIKAFRKHFRLGELWEQGTLGGIP